MTTFVDTSAFYALLDAGDRSHAQAHAWMDDVTSEIEERLVTHAFAVVETLALLHRRLGQEAVRGFVEAVLPAVEVAHVDATLFDRSLGAYVGGMQRRSSFVDRVSFELMRRDGIERAFTFDADFAAAGFIAEPAR